MKKLTLAISDEMHEKIKIFSIKNRKPIVRMFLEAMQNNLESKPNKINKPNNEKPSANQNPQKNQITKLPTKNSEPLFQLVDISAIKHPKTIKRTTATEKLAKSITETGLIKPLLLKQTGINEYECLSAQEELSAVIRAKELNPIKCEMINAFVIPKNCITEVKKQLESLKKIL